MWWRGEYGIFTVLNVCAETSTEPTFRGSATGSAQMKAEDQALGRADLTF